MPWSYLKILKTNLRIRKVTNIQTHIPQVACSCPLLQISKSACVRIPAPGEGEGEGGREKEEKKIRPPGPPREGLLEEFEIKDQGTGAVRP